MSYPPVSSSRNSGCGVNDSGGSCSNLTTSEGLYRYSLPHSSHRALKRQSIAGRAVTASVSARGILCLKNRFFRRWNQWFLQCTTQKYRLSSHMRVVSEQSQGGQGLPLRE